MPLVSWRNNFWRGQAREDIASAAEELAAVRARKQEVDETLTAKDRENTKVGTGRIEPVCSSESQRAKLDRETCNIGLTSGRV